MNAIVREPWIEMLDSACQTSTRAAVAKRIDYSPAVVTEVLKGTYRGDLTRVQRAVEGALMKTTVECPVVGEIQQQKCISHQRASFRATNPAAVQLYKACRSGCTHSLLPKENFE